MPENLFVDPSAIERRAYELYCARGCADGHDLDDWLAVHPDAGLVVVDILIHLPTPRASLPKRRPPPPQSSRLPPNPHPTWGGALS